MIDNFDLISRLFYFNEANGMFFHLQILRRGKDHPELPAANKLIQSWLVRSRNQLMSLKDEIVFLCEHYGARAYINVAGKDFDKLNTLILKKLADNIHTGNIINPWHTYNSACGELKSREKRWIVDIDTKEIDEIAKIQADVQTIWNRTHDNTRGLEIALIPTLHGWHWITRPFDLALFRSLYPDIDVHKNNPTVLYVPHSIINK